MLKSLRRIVQELSSSQSLEKALSLLVEHVKASIETKACSVYLVDDDSNQFVLVASEGPNEHLIGKLRFKLSEGLVGLVSEREEPVNVEDAPGHERFVAYSPEQRKNLHAFLGVPIMYQREVLGVLVVEDDNKRAYDDAEVAFMVTLAAQVAGVLAQAKTSGMLISEIDVKRPKSLKGKIFSGVPGSHGVAIGKAVVVYPPADLNAVPDEKAENVKAELAALDGALLAAKEQVKELGEVISKNLSDDERSLFDVYLRILESDKLISELKHEIKREKYTAQAAVKHVINRRIGQFEQMEDAYLAERATDFRDLGQRVLFHLQSGSKTKIDYPDNTILVGDEVTAASLAEVPESKLRGIVSVKGSGSSHVAILARALGIPTAMGVSGIPLSRIKGQELVIDGYYGQVYVSPQASVKNEFKALMKEEEELDARLQELRDLPAETLDGAGVSLYVNTGLAADISRALSVGAEGVGLYRTEVPFMLRDRFPSEEEQRKIYTQLASAFAPRPVMMRTLDVGGDKALPYFPIEEQNPFLGWRGIRLTLDHPEIFLVQLRAMIRSSVGSDNLHIMLPMIGSIAEVEAALRLISQAHAELIEEGVMVKMPGVGVMIEVPSAVYQIREIAKRVDFVSVGSNDLTQYILAVDRNNSMVANLYDALHPAVLRALMHVVEGAQKERKHVSICGELAADPVAVVLLVAMGFDTLSVSARILPRIKWVIRNFTMTRAKELLSEVMQMDDPIEIRCHMELALEEAGLAGLIRAGKS